MTEFFSTILQKNIEFLNILWKLDQWKSRCYVRTDGRRVRETLGL